MRRLLGTLVLTVVAVGGCSSRKDTDAVMTELVTVLNQTADVLAGVHDKASAEAAKPRLEELAIEFRALRERFSKAVVEGDTSGLKQKHDAQYAEALGRVDKQIQRLKQVDGGAIVLEIVK